MAAEMQRLDLDIPLLIGGATTSRIHTAVKIDPKYSGPVVYVADASRAVGVAGDLLSEDRRHGYVQAIKDEYEQMRTQREQRQSTKKTVSLAQARDNGYQADWESYTPPVPSFLGLKTFDDYDLQELSEYIDWTPFFHT